MKVQDPRTGKNLGVDRRTTTTRMNHGPRSLALVLLATSIAACGGATSTGAIGTGGTDAGSGGKPDAAPSGGAASGGAAGSGGAATGGASAGGGGAGGSSADAGTTAECASNADCKVLKDCCTCEAVPNAEAPGSCGSVCKVDQCTALGLAAPVASCIAGRCVVGFSCDASKVLCKSLAPTCPPGQVALVAGSCWQGSCVPANECTSVQSCNACTGELVCGIFSQLGGLTYHCYDVPAECHGDFGCSCAGAGICAAPGLSCTDLSGLKGIACSCLGC